MKMQITLDITATKKRRKTGNVKNWVRAVLCEPNTVNPKNEIIAATKMNFPSRDI
jgi:hypothetical protein